MTLRALWPTARSKKNSDDPYEKGDEVVEIYVDIQYKTSSGVLFSRQILNGQLEEGYLHPSRVLR